MRPVSRREALQLLGRGVVWGGLGLLTAALVSRSGPPSQPEASCSGGGQCGSCPALDGCGLPRGLSAQLALRGKRGGS